MLLLGVPFVLLEHPWARESRTPIDHRASEAKLRKVVLELVQILLTVLRNHGLPAVPEAPRPPSGGPSAVSAWKESKPESWARRGESGRRMSLREPFRRPHGPTPDDLRQRVRPAGPRDPALTNGGNVFTLVRDGEVLEVTDEVALDGSPISVAAGRSDTAPGAAMPEPSAALLFGVGCLVLSRCFPRGVRERSRSGA